MTDTTDEIGCLNQIQTVGAGFVGEASTVPANSPNGPKLGPPCTIYEDMGELVRRDVTLPYRIAWKRQRHEKSSHLVRAWRMQTAIKLLDNTTQLIKQTDPSSLKYQEVRRCL